MLAILAICVEDMALENDNMMNSDTVFMFIIIIYMGGGLFSEDLADPKRHDERYAWKNRHKRMMEEIKM